LDNGKIHAWEDNEHLLLGSFYIFAASFS